MTVDGEAFALAGRDGVFAARHRLRLRAARRARGDRLATAAAASRCPSARAERRLEPRYVPRRGRRRSSCAAPGRRAARSTTSARPSAFAADRLIAVEVLTPGGNWSSYPPHKHDEDIPGVETALEEIYYFEVAGDGGFGLPARLRPGRAGDRRPRRGPHRRRRADPARLPRPVDGRARLRPLLPQRDGRARASAPGSSATTRPTPGSATPGTDQDVDPRLPLTTAAEEATTVRLTVAQALVRFLAAQYIERDGVRAAADRRLLRHLRPRQRRRRRPGAARAAGRRMPYLPGPQRAGDGARRGRLRAA